ncbi:hypothetical protein [Emticicia sp. 21SJ11W-3]|uniref:hypothetical protein n=1 Tax=Emticicia sp. 21SJ11W-3 TaxID=2916755 RepID=UPI00209CC3FC|nr:hypothetical protein [Emticicia sp. 21SJ11W-3]UTA66188.1 hypothetical protein MB380_11260 [Emticicia sp. 21SJ11W-3]
MNLRTLFTLLLLSTTFLSYSQKQKIKCTNISISYLDDSWSQGPFVGLLTDDGATINVSNAEKGSYTSLQKFKKDYSDLFGHISSQQVSLTGGGKGYLFKGLMKNSGMIIIEMYAEFPNMAYSFTCKYPKESDKEFSTTIIKALSSIEIDEKIEVDITENLEYFVDWKKQGFVPLYVGYPSHPYEKAASLSISYKNKSGLKSGEVDLSWPEIEISIEELILIDMESEMDSLSQLESKKTFADQMFEKKEKNADWKYKQIKSDEMKFTQGKAYRTIIEINSDTSKAYQIYQYFWVNDRIFEMHAQIRNLDANLEKFEKIASSFRIL